MSRQRTGDGKALWRRAILCRSFAILLAIAAFPLGVVTPAAAGPATCDVVIDIDGVAHPFRVEVADTPESRAEGLQGRTSLASGGGMLFDFGRPQSVAMWMKNTPISLDMIFIDASGSVASVAERTTPYSLAIIPSPGPVRAVVEVSAGTAQRIGLKPGAHVIAPCLGSRP